MTRIVIWVVYPRSSITDQFPSVMQCTSYITNVKNPHFARAFESWLRFSPHPNTQNVGTKGEELHVYIYVAWTFMYYLAIFFCFKYKYLYLFSLRRGFQG